MKNCGGISPPGAREKPPVPPPLYLLFTSHFILLFLYFITFDKGDYRKKSQKQVRRIIEDRGKEDKLLM
ncbi:hypothetical protein BGC07_18565 [Piscirickettsia litoralis]|uniref:Uncharacterized protein n=1 Tax=Piscirickettsia litoralis TaxID=1891921 RepID=A0ABX3A0Q2_9GAMM|nr:hypothetical protein BGC07_18565 [Piscirickettsia litoralis]